MFLAWNNRQETTTRVNTWLSLLQKEKQDLKYVYCIFSQEGSIFIKIVLSELPKEGVELQENGRGRR